MKLPKQLRAWLNWWDDHLLIILTGFLLAFIPLYPKLPLFEAIPGYIVRVRLEDIFILITNVVLLLQILRKKVQWQSSLVWVIAAYAVVGLLSSISAIFITQTVPAHELHITKTFLHYLRYLEYFSLFLISFASVKKAKDLKVLLGVMIFTVIGITIYGYGQRAFYWPVYSTMNREFSKGLRLYLTDHARVQSTFGGHYDLAAYLVIVLPFILLLAFSVKKWWLKIGLQIAHWLGVWLLVVSASRTSFGAYLFGIVVAIGIFAWQKPTFWQKMTWGVTRLAFVGILMSLMMLKFGDDMYERLIQVLKGYPQVYAAYQVVEKQQNILINDTLPLALGLKKIDISLPVAQKPENAISTAEAIAIEASKSNVMVSSDTRPTTQRPTDVYVNVPDVVSVSTISATGEVTTILVNQERTYSDCALTKSLSICIRTETLWPRAIAGFWKNPLLGSGYATLTKETEGQFTEAESTDNNFLRTLGETGLLGFVTFYGAVALAIWSVRKSVFAAQPLTRAVSVGLIAASLGLLINAIYIDVFAASKVAQTYWALVGIVLGYVHVTQSKKNLHAFQPVTNKNSRMTLSSSIPNRFTIKTKKVRSSK